MSNLTTAINILGVITMKILVVLNDGSYNSIAFGSVTNDGCICSIIILFAMYAIYL